MSEPKFPPMPSFVPEPGRQEPRSRSGGVTRTGTTRYEPPYDWEARARHLQDCLQGLIDIVENGPEADEVGSDLWTAIHQAKVAIDPTQIGQPAPPFQSNDGVEA